MFLDDKSIAEYQAIYKTEFGEEINKAEAVEQGERLINLFKVIYKPIPKEEASK